MSLLFIVGLILSGAIGLSLGLIGGGGSILTVPILVYFLSVAPHDAVVMSLAVVGTTSLIGSLMHFRRGNVDIRSGVIFGGAGMFGAVAGSPLTALVSPGVLLLSFGLLMFAVAIMMLRKRTKPLEAAEPVPEPNILVSIAAGFGVGVLTGFLGVGGGFLVVPALVFFGGVSMKRAIGTSLFVIFVNCVAGLVGHMEGGDFNWTLTAAVMGLAGIGAVGGTVLSGKLDARRLQTMFAVLVLGVGTFLVFKNFNSAF